MHDPARLSDDALLRAVSILVARDRALTASLLAHLAEVDARRLYLALGHPSMFAYAVEALHLSESAAYRRIHAARAAQRFPQLLALVAEGRVHLAAICLVVPHLSENNFEEVVAAVSHRSKAEVERWLSVRFAPPLLTAAAEPAMAEAPVEFAAAPAAELVPGRVASVETVTAPVAPPPPAVAPHIALRLVLPEATHAKLRHAQALLAHAVPGGDLAQVVDRALDALIAQIERRKAAATNRPRTPRAAVSARTVPAHVRRAVWQRDGARCAFVSRHGRRCSARARLEFDHMDAVARGGTAHAERVRLLCRAHNQFEAERVFGREFMRGRREQARAGRAAPSTRPGTSCGAFGQAPGEQHPPAAPDPAE
jgi:hypothetical protein